MKPQNPFDTEDLEVTEFDKDDKIFQMQLFTDNKKRKGNPIGIATMDTVRRETYNKIIKQERTHLQKEVERIIEQFYSDNIGFSPKLREKLKQKLGLTMK